MSTCMYVQTFVISVSPICIQQIWGQVLQNFPIYPDGDDNDNVNDDDDENDDDNDDDENDDNLEFTI